MADIEDPAEVVLWGWETFFSELVRFIESSERQFGSHANGRYSEYVLDRLELVTQNITDIRRLPGDAQTPATQDGRISLSSLVQSLELLDLRLFSCSEIHWRNTPRWGQMSAFWTTMMMEIAFLISAEIIILLVCRLN